jgi:hypothetical protein
MTRRPGSPRAPHRPVVPEHQVDVSTPAPLHHDLLARLGLAGSACPCYDVRLVQGQCVETA